MNRREILKSGVLATGSLLLSTERMGFKRITHDAVNGETYIALKLLIGELETYILSDGIISLASIQPTFAPGTEESRLTNELSKLHLSPKQMEMGIHVMLIRKEDKLILLDTGSGHHFGENGGKLIPSLQTIGLSPEHITDIVITHAHIDHIGGILNAEDEFIFPHATYHLAKKEYNFWMSEKPDFSNAKGNQSAADFNISFAKNMLAKINDRIQLFDYGQELFSCLIPELAEGHTPGHTIFTIHSRGKFLKHIVDTFHTPFLVSKPDWGTQWDTDFDQAVATRKNIMKEESENSTLLMSCHLPWPGLGFIDKRGKDFYWRIYPYFNPINITI
ncbi:MBL fold metallo-hydrolase [Olivibacter ginsenosidimutans]|uniref:MBL fold metallo-hydrolase n=1 Tax=Olivibacter ginsenosidimutans TaxID=1176537 RepID=A0ABP9C8P5_9SPHI